MFGEKVYEYTWYLLVIIYNDKLHEKYVYTLRTLLKIKSNDKKSTNTATDSIWQLIPAFEMRTKRNANCQQFPTELEQRELISPLRARAIWTTFAYQIFHYHLKFSFNNPLWICAIFLVEHDILNFLRKQTKLPSTELERERSKNVLFIDCRRTRNLDQFVHVTPSPRDESEYSLQIESSDRQTVFLVTTERKRIWFYILHAAIILWIEKSKRRQKNNESIKNTKENNLDCILFYISFIFSHDILLFLFPLH